MEEGDTREPVLKDVRLLVPIEKTDSPQRVTYGVVLEPDTEDLQGDVMTAEDIEKAAYDWMERSQRGGRMHAELVEGAKVVESYIAPCDIPVETAAGPETIRKGSWVLAMRWPAGDLGEHPEGRTHRVLRGRNRRAPGDREARQPRSIRARQLGPRPHDSCRPGQCGGQGGASASECRGHLRLRAHQVYRPGGRH